MRLEVAAADEDPEEDAGDVGVEDCSALTERKTPDRPRGVGADAFERQQRLLVGRELTAVARDRFARDRLKPARPDVVAERPPGVGDVAFGGGGERFERRVLLQ